MKAPAKSFDARECKYCGGELEDYAYDVCENCGRKANSYHHGCFIVVSVPEDEDRQWIGGHFKKAPRGDDNSQGLPTGIRAEYWHLGEPKGLFEVVSVWKNVTPKGYKFKGDGVYLKPKPKAKK